MNREQALELVEQHLKNRNLVKHCLAVEACMRDFAAHFGQDPEPWGLAGLLHDLDYEYTVETPGRAHGEDGRDAGGVRPGSRRSSTPSRPTTCGSSRGSHMDHLPADHRSGQRLHHRLRPDAPRPQAAGLDLPFLKKRFKEKSFAKGASREQMAGCAKLGMDLDEFLALCLGAMQKIASELGL